MLNAVVPARTSGAAGGRHGRIYVPRPRNILIGAVPHLRVAGPRDYADKKRHSLWRFLLINLVDVIGLEPTTSSM